MAADPAVPIGPGAKPRVLLVDDEGAVLAALRRNLVTRFDVHVCHSGEEAVAALAAPGATPFAVLISDMQMPGLSGADLLSRAREIAPATTRMLLTGHSDLGMAVRAIDEGQL